MLDQVSQPRLREARLLELDQSQGLLVEGRRHPLTSRIVHDDTPELLNGLLEVTRRLVPAASVGAGSRHPEVRLAHRVLGLVGERGIREPAHELPETGDGERIVALGQVERRGLEGLLGAGSVRRPPRRGGGDRGRGRRGLAGGRASTSGHLTAQRVQAPRHVLEPGRHPAELGGDVVEPGRQRVDLSRRLRRLRPCAAIGLADRRLRLGPAPVHREREGVQVLAELGHVLGQALVAGGAAAGHGRRREEPENDEGEPEAPLRVLPHRGRST